MSILQLPASARLPLADRPNTAVIMLAIAVLFGACSSPESATTNSAAVAVADASGAALGSVALPGSCAGDAGVHLNRGLALLHNMTYIEAAGHFASAANVDPECVFAYWGEAMTIVHPLWPDVPSAEGLERGAALLATARAARALTEREEAYVSALEAYFHDAATTTETQRLASLSEGWRLAVESAPADVEAKLFHALSLIALAGGAEDRVGARAAAGQLAEEVLEVVPDHPGALHYLIHAYDHPALAQKALDAARVYGAVAPANSHALHMTSHIFTRVGDWEQSIKFNERAADAALAQGHADAVSFHYLHAADYLVYAALQRLDLGRALSVWEKIENIDGPVADHAATAYAYAAVPARIALEQGNWTAARQLNERYPSVVNWDKYPHLEAITVFSRAMGAARTGYLHDAERMAGHLTELRDGAAGLPGSYDWATQVEIQEKAVRAWVAYARGEEGALELMRSARDLEATTEKNPVTPGEVLPAAELLADMLMRERQFSEAADAYEAALTRTPNRFNSMFGAARAAEQLGELERAAKHFRALLNAVSPAADDERLAHAQRFLMNA